jgi:hypothetical protein
MRLSAPILSEKCPKKQVKFYARSEFYLLISQNTLDASDREWDPIRNDPRFQKLLCTPP